MASSRIRHLLKDFFLRQRRRGALASLPLLFIATAAAAAEKRIPVFPETPYEGFIIYESLALFWIAILALIVVLRMKLREIERIQALGLEKEAGDVPLLE